MFSGTTQISQYAKQPQPHQFQPQPPKSQSQPQASPQQSTGSVMMDITDTATAAARPATDDLTLAGYTRAIEQGRHPAWGAQQTSQLEDATPIKQQAATPQAARSRLATSTRKGQVSLAYEGKHCMLCLFGLCMHQVECPATVVTLIPWVQDRSCNRKLQALLLNAANLQTQWAAELSFCCIVLTNTIRAALSAIDRSVAMRRPSCWFNVHR